MVRSRVVPALAGLVLAVSFGFLQCAEPTQIVVDVRTDACLYVRSTGIAVSRAADIDRAPLATFKNAANGSACEVADRIGTLTVYPGGEEKDGEVSVRVVAGIDKLASECVPPWHGCVVARRRMRFIPGESQTQVVILSLACRGRDCPKDSECNSAGECVGVATPTPDAGPAVEAGGNCKGLCTGPGRVCINDLCVVDCGAVDCAGKSVCPEGADCLVRCPTRDSCRDATCRTSSSCRVECSFDRACSATGCNAGRCDIDCQVDGACEDIGVSGGDAGIVCRDDGDPCQRAAWCDAGKCNLACTPAPTSERGTCPAPAHCSARMPPTPEVCVGPWSP